jgi:hypothetical protein
MNQKSFLLFWRNNPGLWALTMLLLFFLSCEKEYDPLFKNGVICGYVSTYNYDNDTGNYRVIAKGPYGSKTVDFGPREMYWIDSLANGTYSLEFVKKGYGTVHQYGIQVFGNDTVAADYVYLFNKYEDYVMPSFIKAYATTGDMHYPSQSLVTIEISKTVFVNHWGFPILLFLSDNKNVSSTDFQFYYPAWDAGINADFTHVIYLNPEWLPFKSGTQVYIIGYVFDMDEYSEGMLNTYLGVPQFSSLDKDRHSNTVSFIMP